MEFQGYITLSNNGDVHDHGACDSRAAGPSMQLPPTSPTPY